MTINVISTSLHHYFWLLLLIFVKSVHLDSQPLIEPNLEGLIAAFGDFDGDKKTDIFVIRDDRTFTIIQGRTENPTLKSRDDWTCKLPEKFTGEIVSLMPADFTGNGNLDLLIVTQRQTPQEDKMYAIYLMVNRGLLNTIKICKWLENAPKIENITSQPFVFDYNSDMVADIFALSEDGKRTVWTLGPDGVFYSKAIFNIEKSAFRKDFYSHAFVDLDNNTSSDVFIDGGDHFEYWNLGATGFPAEPRRIDRPENKQVIGQSSFIDHDSTGNIDHLLPVCSDDDCKDSAILLSTTSGLEWKPIAGPFKSVNSSEVRFIPKHKVLKFELPPTLRHADFNGDGFPDFVSVVNIAGKAVVALFLNQPSTKFHGQRTFVIAKEFDFGENTPIVAAFFDLLEDGKPDIIVTTRDPSNKLLIEVKSNDFMFDACFIKVMVASGLKSDSTHGTNQPGPLVCHELVDTEGWLRRGCQGQLTQSTFLPLQMPFIIFGLGSTPNFVDKVTATIPSPNSSSLRTREWYQIVPDAQILLIPNPLDSPFQWRSKLFLTPSDMVISTLITLSSICIVLVVLIGILHRKEILEDIAEHEEYKRHVPR